MFALRARLNLSVQTIGHVFDIQGRHGFLQNAASMEESTLTVKLRRSPNPWRRKELEPEIHQKTAMQTDVTISPNVLARADRVIK
jgi:hypothetical protein